MLTDCVFYDIDNDRLTIQRIYNNDAFYFKGILDFCTYTSDGLVSYKAIYIGEL